MIDKFKYSFWLKQKIDFYLEFNKACDSFSEFLYKVLVIRFEICFYCYLKLKGNKMDQNLRQSIQTNTFYYFLIVMVLTTISQLSTMMVIVFGNISGKELLVAASVVAPTIIGAFGIIRILTNFMVLIKDMDEKISKTNYGKEVQTIPLHILRFVFSGIFVIVAIIQLVTIYS